MADVSLQGGAAQSTFFDSANTVHTFSGVVVNSGTNTAMAVCVEFEEAITASSVTYNGVSLTKKDNQAGGSFGGSDIWYLAAPDTGTHDVVVTSASTNRLVVGVYVADDVDQTTVLRPAVKSSGTSTSVTNSLAFVSSGDLLFDSLNIDSTGHATAPGANETERWDIETAASRNTGVSDTQAGSDGVVMSHTWTTSAEFKHVVTAFKAFGSAADPPSVTTTAESATTTAGTSHTITMPSGIVSGDLLLVCLDKGSTAATINALAGWTELLDENSGNGLYIAYRLADGTEGASITLTSSASTRDATIAVRITGAIDPATQAPQIGSTSSGTSTTPDPPSVTPTGGAKDYLWVTFFGGAGEEADDDTWSDTPPTNYSPSPPLQKACGTVGTNLGGKIALAYRNVNAASEDPGTFAQDVSTAWRAQTIAVHPPAAAAATVIPDVVTARRQI